MTPVDRHSDHADRLALPRRFLFSAYLSVNPDNSYLFLYSGRQYTITPVQCHSTMKRIAVALFRNDLRLHDNPMLAAASHFANKSNDHQGFVLPFYAFDSRQINLSPLNGISSDHFEPARTWEFNMPRCQNYRAKSVFQVYSSSSLIIGSQVLGRECDGAQEEPTSKRFGPMYSLWPAREARDRSRQISARAARSGQG